MQGLKVFLLISFIAGAIWSLLLLFLPEQLVELKMGPESSVSARYFGAVGLALTTANWYALRNPGRNIAVVRALIVLGGLAALVGLYHGIAGNEVWGTALLKIVPAAVLAAGLGYFHPRGEKAT